jgi:hypothetical protein
VVGFVVAPVGLVVVVGFVVAPVGLVVVVGFVGAPVGLVVVVDAAAPAGLAVVAVDFTVVTGDLDGESDPHAATNDVIASATAAVLRWCILFLRWGVLEARAACSPATTARIVRVVDFVTCPMLTSSLLRQGRGRTSHGARSHLRKSSSVTKEC